MNEGPDTATTPEPAPTKVERFGLDAKKQLHSEGYYAVTDKGELILVPPTGELHPKKLALGYRLAHIADVDKAGGAQDGVGRPAQIDELVIPAEHPDFEHHPDAHVDADV